MAKKIDEANDEGIITITVKGVDLKFDVTDDNYSAFINGSMATDKIQAMNNLLIMSVISGSRDSLNDILNGRKRPSKIIAICAALIEEYDPDLDVTIKK